ncbi:MAG TPA: hypothetical protein VFM25_02240, partial [Verrucomicrobiae bacterium]|nr:hypothetical protein [Verrucomicrobiae bacterium]
MNASEAQVVHAPAEEPMLKRAAGGLVGEAIGSIAVIALAIVGLVGILSTTMAAIATIVLGVSILLESGMFAGSAEML